MKTVTDLFQEHIGAKEYDDFVCKMLKWYYGQVRKVAWCAVSMSYFMNKLGLLDQIGGKHQNVYQMMVACEKACKETGIGKFYRKAAIPKNHVMKRGTIVFMLKSDPPMTATSSKHVTSVYEAATYTGSGNWKSLGGNQDDEIKIKSYTQGSIYAIYEPDYSLENDDITPDTVKKGSKGNDVVMLQCYLNQLGFPDDKFEPLALDGSCGKLTEQAIKRFQSHYKLKVDGICGPKTWTKLFEVMKEPPTQVQLLTDCVVYKGPGTNYGKKTTLKKGARAVYSFAEDGWLYLPRWGGCVSSKKEFVKIV